MIYANSAAGGAPSCEEEVVARAPQWLASPEGQAAPWFVVLAVKREVEQCARYLASTCNTILGGPHV
jgi:hypothetical protein